MLNCNYYNEIKNELINNEIYKRVKDYSKNRNELSVYYNVGKLLSEAGKHYGEGIIKEYSRKLTIEIGSGYGISNLKRMRQFYLIVEKGVALPHQLSWSHILAILPINNINEINYYISISIEQNLSYRQLREKIKSKEYQRLDDKTKLKLINKEETAVSDFIKNPIIIRNKYNVDKEHITEKILQKLILEDIEKFLLELGTGFSFIKSEYKIKIGSTYNYIDLLLFNYTYNCFVVIELKVTELKKEHIGQIEVYMNYVDKNIKTINQDKTIGVIICKKDNGYYIEYSSDSRIYHKEYILN
jgi:predicted nuclease of restriction endonuclease-like (RecB) superfamily